MALKIYKHGQAGYTRMGSAIGLVVIGTIACYKLYERLMDMTWIESKNARMMVATMVPSAVFVILGFLIYLLINKPAVSDFLIASEGEVKKVNWSSRKEIAVSTFIVIVVVAIVSVILGVADLFFQWSITRII